MQRSINSLIAIFILLSISTICVADRYTVTQIAETQKKIAQLLQTSNTFDQLASQPHPKGLTKDQIKEAQKYNRWLRQKSSELKHFANKWRSATGRLDSANQQFMELQRSYNFQYLQLQNKISKENREYQLLSNIMKKRHDTAKNAINNMR